MTKLDNSSLEKCIERINIQMDNGQIVYDLKPLYQLALEAKPQPLQPSVQNG